MKLTGLVHRLTAALALIIHLSPQYKDGIKPLLEVLQAKEILLSKLDSQLIGGKEITKREVKQLIQEVASKLCP
jgi:desumoylating isopeptidase 1